MKIKQLNEIKNGTRVIGFYLVKSVQSRTTKTDKPYIDFSFGDSTGEVNGKWWDVKSHSEAEEFQAGTLVKVEADVDRYLDAVQFSVKRIRLVTESDPVDIRDYVRTAPLTEDVMMGELGSYVSKIKNSVYKNIAIEMVKRKMEKLKYYPAAMRNHHAFMGGLLYHTISMLKLAEQVGTLYPFLNMDLLLTGVIIHDLEKTEEMIASQLGAVEDYSLDGKLLGHIAMGAVTVKEVAVAMGATAEQTSLLMHMVLSHHGKKEYGSPVLPLIPEAEALHHIDNIDARMNMFMSALENVEPGSFSERVFALENRQIYKAMG